MRRMDVVMLALLNAQERTEAEFRELFAAAGEGFVFKVSFFFLLFSFLFCIDEFVGVSGLDADGDGYLGCSEAQGMPDEHYRGCLAA
jgi:hypothetical protein